MNFGNQDAGSTGSGKIAEIMRRQGSRAAAFILVTLVCCTGRQVLSQDNPVFRFTKAIQLPESSQDELYSVAIDSEMYAETQDGFPDVRIQDAAGRNIPIVIRNLTESRPVSVRKTWTPDNVSLQPGDSSLEIQVQLRPEDPEPRGLRIMTPLKDFEHQIQVFAVANGTETALTSGAIIFDYSKFMDVRRTEIPLAPGSARQFRIVIDSLTAEQQSPLVELQQTLNAGATVSRTETTTLERRPFRIDRLEFWNDAAAETHYASTLVTWDPVSLESSGDADHRQTIVSLTTDGEPVTSLQIETMDRNFRRMVMVEKPSVKGQDSEWVPIAEGTISRFQLRDFREEALTIEIPETRSRNLRIRIPHGENPPLTVDRVRLTGPRHEIVFLASPQESLQLNFGSANAEAPHQDDSALQLALSRKMRPISVTAGPATRLTQSAGGSVRPRDLINNPLILGAVIAVLIVALGWGLFSAAKRVDSIPPVSGDRTLPGDK